MTAATSASPYAVMVSNSDNFAFLDMLYLKSRDNPVNPGFCETVM